MDTTIRRRSSIVLEPYTERPTALTLARALPIDGASRDGSVKIRPSEGEHVGEVSAVVVISRVAKLG